MLGYNYTTDTAIPTKVTITPQGDYFRRLHPELSGLDSPCKYGIYSLKLKQMLLDNLTRQQTKKSVAKPESVPSDQDTSNGLVSRLDKVSTAIT